MSRSLYTFLVNSYVKDDVGKDIILFFTFSPNFLYNPQANSPSFEAMSRIFAVSDIASYGSMSITLCIVSVGVTTSESESLPNFFKASSTRPYIILSSCSVLIDP